MEPTPRALIKKLLMDSGTPAKPAHPSSASRPPSTSTLAAPPTSATPPAAKRLASELDAGSASKRAHLPQASLAPGGPGSARKKPRVKETPRSLIRAVAEDLGPSSHSVSKRKGPTTPSSMSSLSTSGGGGNNTSVLASASKPRSRPSEHEHQHQRLQPPGSARHPQQGRGQSALAPMDETPRALLRGVIASMDTPLQTPAATPKPSKATVSPRTSSPLVGKVTSAAAPTPASAPVLSAAPPSATKPSPLNASFQGLAGDNYANTDDMSEDEAPASPPPREHQPLSTQEQLIVDRTVADEQSVEQAQRERLMRLLAVSSGGKSKETPSAASKARKNHALSPAITKALFTSFSKSRVSADAMEAVQQGVEKFLEQVSDDLVAYAQHARRKTIEQQDVVFLLQRQSQISKHQSFETLVHNNLPMEYVEAVLPIARAKPSVPKH